MHQIFQKEIDEQGRIILPREWRKALKTPKIILIMEDKTLRIFPESKSLVSFFGKAQPSTLRPDPFEDYRQSLAEASSS